MSAEVIKMSNQDKDRNVALESAIGQIEKAFGKGSVMKLGMTGSNLDLFVVNAKSYFSLTILTIPSLCNP